MRRTVILLLVLALALPLATAGAQGPKPGEGPLPERLLQREEMPWVESGPARDEEAHPTSLLWYIERVDAEKTFSLMGPRSLALDSSCHLHLARGQDYPYNAWYDGTTWHLETVDSAGDVGQYTSLALDAAGRPHISYYGNSALKYAHHDGTAWQVQTVDSAGGVGYYTSLALDAAGRPHISYYDWGNRDLKYAHYNGTAWQIETVDSAGDVGQYTSLALDANGRPHISYYDGSNDDLKYAYYDGRAWHIQTVDSAGGVGYYTSLALDTNGRPHISYYDWGNRDLKYVHYNGTAWHIETVDSAGEVGEFTSLALDAAGRPHITYHDGRYSHLKYAYYDGTAWHIETVDSAWGAGLFTSVALGPSGLPYVSYLESYPNYDLKYAHYDGTAWQIETVDNAGMVYHETSLALDENGRPHISYYDNTNGDLKYAWRDVEPDIGFRPNPHGYAFSNSDSRWGTYPFPPADRDFTVEDMRRMFGDDAVCAISRPTCIPRPAALLWLIGVNMAMNGGHCDGMASTSLRFFKGLDSPSDFQAGAQAAHDLQLGNVRRHIAYYFVEQATDPVRAYKEQVRFNTPTAILEQLRLAMSYGAPDPTTLFIRQAGQGGHAITPYAIEDRGAGVYWIRVYDNNYPDDEDRYVVINTTNDTWSYDMGDGLGTWHGDANTHSLGIVPISKYAEQPVCPWCGGTKTLAGSPAGEIWLAGSGHLLITDAQGWRIGYVGDQFVNEIPGAYGGIIDGGLGVELEPIYVLPLTDTYTILLDGQILTRTHTAAVTQFGPGYAVSVRDIAVDETTRDVLTFAPNGTELAYRSSGDKETTFILALDQISKSVEFEIRRADIGADQVVTLTANMATGQLAFNNAVSGGGEYDLEVWRVAAAGEQWFVHTGLVISATDTHYVDYGTWDGYGPMTLYVDHGSDGTIDETWKVDNQVRRIYLPVVTKGL